MSSTYSTYTDSRLNFFAEKYHLSAHLLLAMQAAVPIALTPDLLYKLWLNFQHAEDGTKLEIPLIAIADILSSSICRKVGSNIFEIYPEIREELRNHLLAQPNGAERQLKIAQFIQSYLDLCRDKIPTQVFYDALHVNSLSIIDPSQALTKIMSILKDQQIPNAERIAKANTQLDWTIIPRTEGGGNSFLKSAKEIIKSLHEYYKGDKTNAIKALTKYKDVFQKEESTGEGIFSLQIKQNLFDQLAGLEIGDGDGGSTDSSFLTKEQIKASFLEKIKTEDNEKVKGLLLIFKDEKEQDWLIATNKRVICINDDDGNSETQKEIKIDLPHSVIGNDVGSKMETINAEVGVFNIGSEDCRVSLNLFESLLEAAVLDIREFIRLAAYTYFSEEPNYGNTFFLGRDLELEYLNQMTLDTNAIIQINGHVGCGKTEFAKVYILEYGHFYDHVIWIEQDGDLKETFLKDKKLAKFFSDKFIGDTVPDRFSIEGLVEILHEVEGRNLIIIDNVNKDFSGEHLWGEGWQVILISREKLPSFRELKLGVLSGKLCKEVFEHYYKGEVDEELLDDLAGILDLNVGLIEMFAKVGSRLDTSMEYLVDGHHVDINDLWRRYRAEGYEKTLEYITSEFTKSKAIEENKDRWDTLAISIQNGTQLTYQYTIDGKPQMFYNVREDLSQIEEHATEIHTKRSLDENLIKSLTELLIPSELVIVLKDSLNIILSLDERSSMMPWEQILASIKLYKSWFGVVRQSPYGADRYSRKLVTNNEALVIAGSESLEESFMARLLDAEKEAELLNELLVEKGKTVTKLISASNRMITNALFGAEYEMLHISTLAAYDHIAHQSSLNLGGEHLFEVKQLRKLDTVPSFVFINGCYDINELKEVREIRGGGRFGIGIGAELLDIGVKAILVVNEKMSSEVSYVFTKVFYEHLLKGVLFGLAAKLARIACISKFPNMNTWGSIQLYGDPSYKLNKDVSKSSFEEPKATEIDKPENKKIRIKVPKEFAESARKKDIGNIGIVKSGGNIGVGFLISPRGHILTCSYLMDKGTEVSFRKKGSSKEVLAKVLTFNEISGIGLLKIEGYDHDFLRLIEEDSSDLKRNDEVRMFTRFSEDEKSASEFKLREGNITVVSGVESFCFEVEGEIGFLGSAVCRGSDGKVVGILQGNARVRSNSSINIASNINDVFEFLTVDYVDVEALNVRLNELRGNTEDGAASEVAGIVEDLLAVGYRDIKLDNLHLGGLSRNLLIQTITSINQVDSLKGANLSKLNFEGGSFHEVDLSGVNFSNSNLSGVDLVAKLYGANFENANLEGAKLSSAGVDNSDWILKLKEWNVKGAEEINQLYMVGANTYLTKEKIDVGCFLTDRDKKNSQPRYIWSLSESLDAESFKEIKLAMGFSWYFYKPDPLLRVYSVQIGVFKELKAAMQFAEDRQDENPEPVIIISSILNEVEVHKVNIGMCLSKEQASNILEDLYVKKVKGFVQNIKGSVLSGEDRSQYVEKLTEELDDYRGYSENRHAAAQVGVILRELIDNGADMDAIDLSNLHLGLTPKELVIKAIQSVVSIASLEGVDLSESDLRNLNFDKLVIRSGNFENALLEGASFKGTYLYGSNLKAANLKGADFSEANLENVDLTKAILEKTRLRKANLKNADLSLCILEKANLGESNLENALIIGVDLKEVNLNKASLEGVVVEGENWIENLKALKVIGAIWVEDNYFLNPKDGQSGFFILEKYKDDIDWRIAEKENSIMAYEHFLKIHPTSKFSTKAQERLNELKQDDPDYDSVPRENRGEYIDPRDSQKYKTIKLKDGNTWMAENFNFKVTQSKPYSNTSRIKRVGLLYTWEGAQSACPPGWHLPNLEDWTKLKKAYGDDDLLYQKLEDGGRTSFNALLAGHHNTDGVHLGLGNYGRYWLSDESKDEEAYYFYFIKSSGQVGENTNDKNFSFSVRYIKNDGKYEQDQWKEVKQVDTNEAYQKYLKDFPEGMHRDEAQRRIDDLFEDGYWAGVLKLTTKNNVEKYIENYPQGKYMEAARSMLANFGSGPEKNKPDEEVLASIEKISFNKTMMVLKLSEDANKRYYTGARSLKDVFQHFTPEVEVRVKDLEGMVTSAVIPFMEVEDFSVLSMVNNINPLYKLRNTGVIINYLLEKLKEIVPGNFNRYVLNVEGEWFSILGNKLSEIIEKNVDSFSIGEREFDLIKERVEFWSRTFNLSELSQVRNIVKSSFEEFIESGLENEVKEGLKICYELDAEFWDLKTSGHSDISKFLRQHLERIDECLTENVKRILPKTRRLERNYRALDLFFNSIIIKLSAPQLKLVNSDIDFGTAEGYRFFETEFGGKSDYFEFQNDFSFVVIPELITNPRSLKRITKFVHSQKAILLTDYYNHSSIGESIDHIDRLKDFGGIEDYWSSAVMIYNWIVGRAKMENYGEREDIYIPPSVLLAGLLMAASRPFTQFLIYSGSRLSTRFKLNSEDLSLLNRKGLMVATFNYSDIEFKGDQTLYTANYAALAQLSTTRILYWINRSISHYLHQVIIQKIAPIRLQKEIQRETRAFLRTLMNEGSINNFSVVFDSEPTETSADFILKLIVWPLYQSQSIVVKYESISSGKIDSEILFEE